MNKTPAKPNKWLLFLAGTVLVAALIGLNVLANQAANDNQGKLELTTARIAALRSRYVSAEKKLEEKQQLSFLNNELRRELKTNLDSFFSNEQLKGEVPEDIFPADADFVYIHRQTLVSDRTTGAIFLPKDTRQRLVFYLENENDSLSFSPSPLDELKFDLAQSGWTPFAWNVKQLDDETQIVFECEGQMSQVFSLPKSVKESEGYSQGYNYHPLNVANRFEHNILHESTFPDSLKDKWLVWSGVTTYHFRSDEDDSMTSVRIVICLETDEDVDWVDQNSFSPGGATE